MWPVCHKCLVAKSVRVPPPCLLHFRSVASLSLSALPPQVVLAFILLILVLLMIRLDGPGMRLKFVLMPLWIVDGCVCGVSRHPPPSRPARAHAGMPQTCACGLHPLLCPRAELVLCLQPSRARLVVLVSFLTWIVLSVKAYRQGEAKGCFLMFFLYLLFLAVR